MVARVLQGIYMVDWWLEVRDWNLEEGFEGVEFLVLGV